MDETDICYLTALELRALYTKRELSPVDVTEAVLARIEREDDRIRAFVTLTPELAREHARAAELAYMSGTPGPLAGVPMSIKDLTLTKGIRTTRGSLLFKDDVPTEDPPLVEQMYAAGGVMLGKTSTPEAGWKGASTNRLGPPTQNPWKIGRTPGGSSSGAAAAIAMGFGPIAEGSDGAGSIRIPSGFCGVYGIKPSFGRVGGRISSGLLGGQGPIARSVRDAALMLDVIAGEDPRTPLSVAADQNYLDAAESGRREGALAGLRVAWSRDLGYAAVDDEVVAIAEAAARRFVELGCAVEEAHPDAGDPWEIEDVIWQATQAVTYQDLDEEQRALLDPGRVRVMQSGLALTAADLSRAVTRKGEYYETVRKFFERYDLLLTPTLPIPAFPVEQDFPPEIAGRPMSYLGWTAFTYPFNVTGNPAATCPAGFTADGLPVGLQIVGPWRADAAVLRASAAFEQIAPWSERRPPGA